MKTLLMNLCDICWGKVALQPENKIEKRWPPGNCLEFAKNMPKQPIPGVILKFQKH